MKATASHPNTRYRPYFWEKFTSWSLSRSRSNSKSTMPIWVDQGLRALRDGLGQEAGSVPSLRYLHRVEVKDDDRSEERPPASYRAEHATLVLFGLHQHGATEPVHRPGVGLGTACRALRIHQFSGSATQRRLTAAATARDIEEVVQHLRSLISLFRQAHIKLDYTRLYLDLCVWLTPRQGRVLRAWGLQFTDPASEGSVEASSGQSSAIPLWVTFVPGQTHAGAELAALRSGVGREAGTVPVMWPFYRTQMGTDLRNQGALTRDLVAEHAALTLFGIHQHGRSRQVHVPGISPGSACRLLLSKGRAEMERRLGNLLTSLDTDELTWHLRALVPMLRQHSIGLDYNVLRKALRHWDDPKRPDEQSHFRTVWDRDFHTGTDIPET
ncbi:type I-E CRISPR-associated protein Cse2/CasB [Streptomyces sp. NPDC005799]|uniref:type I-E CRISPR-associated protein Cse2/CasB n=1 Tax=Streptomyces sp. NPDC005799 TaxID=3154678 RepID=UPI0033C5DF6B